MGRKIFGIPGIGLQKYKERNAAGDSPLILWIVVLNLNVKTGTLAIFQP